MSKSSLYCSQFVAQSFAPGSVHKHLNTLRTTENMKTKCVCASVAQKTPNSFFICKNQSLFYKAP